MYIRALHWLPNQAVIEHFRFLSFAEPPGCSHHWLPCPGLQGSETAGFTVVGGGRLLYNGEGRREEGKQFQGQLTGRARSMGFAYALSFQGEGRQNSDEA